MIIAHVGTSSDSGDSSDSSIGGSSRSDSGSGDSSRSHDSSRSQGAQGALCLLRDARYEESFWRAAGRTEVARGSVLST